MTRQRHLPLSRTFRTVSLLLATLVAVVLDQATKLYAIEHWKEAPPLIFLMDIFRIDYAENHGAFLSLLANMPDAIRFWVLTVINGGVLLGLSIYLIAAKSISITTYLPLLLVVIGGVGNLIDRIRFGYVVDFMNMGIGGLRTGIFNVADLFISAGFVLMAWYMLKGEYQPEDAPRPIAADDAGKGEFPSGPTTLPEVSHGGKI